MSILTCPRCFSEIAASVDVRFCPHCGLADVLRVAGDHQPVLLSIDGRSYRVMDRLGVGSLASVYRCGLGADSSASIGVFKIARDARSNAALENEASALRELQASPAADRFSAFLPRLVDSFLQGGSQAEQARRANVLAYHAEISSPDDLYTLDEVRSAYPAGLDQKDVAWMWRRLLHVLSFCHNSGIAHAAVLPAHVLIEPVDHKLVLIDFCSANNQRQWSVAPSAATTAPLAKWFARDGLPRMVSPALDISLAAKCMIYLMGDAAGNWPEFIDPAVKRHFERCADVPDQSHPTAADLLSQFDRLIEALWGPRQFRPLAMPKRKK